MHSFETISAVGMLGAAVVFPGSNQVWHAIKTWLVLWNMAFIFPYIGNFIIPTDFHIFQRGRYTTKQKINQVVSDVQFRWVSPKLVYLPVPSMDILQFTIVNHHIGR